MKSWQNSVMALSKSKRLGDESSLKKRHLEWFSKQVLASR
jgi:hypothetical protein